MQTMRLTQDDLGDLLTGHTINAMMSDGMEVITLADRPPLLHVAVVGNAFDV